jgi:YaiO family outer membrane protein
MRAAALALLALSIAAPVQATSTTVGVDWTGESLGQDQPDWREVSARLQHTLAPREVLDLAITGSTRFGLHDRQFGLNYAVPLSSTVVASLEANASPSHKVLARHAIGAALQVEFVPTWLVHGGLRTTSYDNAHVLQGLVMLEHYVGPWRLAGSWRPTRAFGGTAHGVAAQAAWYYGDKDFVNVSVASGREAATASNGVSVSNVRSYGLNGRHQFGPEWSLQYGLARTRQGSLYTRTGLHFGMAHSF